MSLYIPSSFLPMDNIEFSPRRRWSSLYIFPCSSPCIIRSKTPLIMRVWKSFSCKVTDFCMRLSCGTKGNTLSIVCRRIWKSGCRHPSNRVSHSRPPLVVINRLLFHSPRLPRFIYETKSFSPSSLPKGSSPVSNWNIMTPKEKMSVVGSTVASLLGFSCSGGI